MIPSPHPLPDPDLERRAARIQWLLLDVDGVLTDGRLRYTERGEEMKVFHVRDGLGVRMAQRAGLTVGVLSGRSGPALERRARELDLDPLIVGSKHKVADLERFCDERGTTPDSIAYVGDDLQDLGVLRRCGLAFAPADAATEVRDVVHHVLRTAGGRGAVRELVETLLRARGEWDRILAGYLDGD
ncbi:MAG: HAD-IIIA family hydrolase [Acidobacteriota bacterium]